MMMSPLLSGPPWYHESDVDISQWNSITAIIFSLGYSSGGDVPYQRATRESHSHPNPRPPAVHQALGRLWHAGRNVSRAGSWVGSVFAWLLSILSILNLLRCPYLMVFWIRGFIFIEGCSVVGSSEVVFLCRVCLQDGGWRDYETHRDNISQWCHPKASHAGGQSANDYGERITRVTGVTGNSRALTWIRDLCCV